MKDLKQYLITEENTKVLVGESFLIEDDLERTFRQLIDDAAYNLEKDFNISKTPAEIAEIVCKAMERYKNFK